MYRVWVPCFIGEKKTPELVQNMYRFLNSQWQIGQNQSCVSTCQRFHSSNSRSHCEVKSVGDVWDTYYILRLASDSYEILCNYIFLRFTHIPLSETRYGS